MSINLLACRELLLSGLKKLDIKTSDQQLDYLLSYLEIFHKWNKAVNLSSIRNPEQMVTRHLLDSLVLVPYLQDYLDNSQAHNLRLIDVGSGGGLPGLPLAIYFPEIKVTLLDSNGKKTRFLFQTALKLGLLNIDVENERVEHFKPEKKFHLITSRAFASLSHMVEGTEHLLADKGQYWAMKGQYPEAELKQCSEKVDMIAAHQLQVPECNEERYLIVLTSR